MKKRLSRIFASSLLLIAVVSILTGCKKNVVFYIDNNISTLVEANKGIVE